MRSPVTVTNFHTGGGTLFVSTAAQLPTRSLSRELIAQLHEKIGQLSVEVDWLKKKCRQLGL